MIYNTLVLKEKNDNGNYQFVSYVDSVGFGVTALPVIYSIDMTIEILKNFYEDIWGIKLEQSEYDKVEFKKIEINFIGE